MRNVGLDEAQDGIKITGRNINNLRYADDTILMAESEEEIKSLLIKAKEETENVGLQLNIQKTKIMVSGLITSWKIDGETVEIVEDYFWGGSKITAGCDCSHKIKRRLLCQKTLAMTMWTCDPHSQRLWEKSYDQPRQHIKKWRLYFANKVLSSQGYGFSSSHVCM